MDDGATPLVARTPEELGFEGGVRHLSVGDTMALVADHNDSVVAVSLSSLEVVAKLPSYSEAAIACLAINHDCTAAVIVYANQRVMEVRGLNPALSSISFPGEFINCPLHPVFSLPVLSITKGLAFTKVMQLHVFATLRPEHGKSINMPSFIGLL